MKERINVLWFKRDLRVSDHKPLLEATSSKLRTLCFFTFEPLVECNYDFDIRHWQFAYQSLLEMRRSLPVHLFNDYIENVFESVLENYEIQAVFSHQETGNYETFQRDLKLKKYLKSHKILWKEYQSNGVIRGLKDRSTWDAAWASYVNSPVIENTLSSSQFISLDEMNSGLEDDLVASLLDKKWDYAGHIQAKKLLKNFLDEKIEDYFKNISYPDKSRYHCSRLSANISWGNLSIREVYSECKKKRHFIKNKMSVDQFMARLKWHCHFIQKLEMEPEIEFKNLNPSFNHLREKKNKRHIKAWKSGMTGYPLIDAAMRCVDETGYLNFRLRSCVASFLTHLLWQPWQEGAKYLAKKFIDYEPGIHFSQFQMQAGTTGINTIRIYNPVKQSLEKDKQAVFIKQWLPELRDLPVEFAHQPWLMTPMDEMMYDFNYGKDYPKRIVDHETASKEAREKLWSIKKSEQNKLHSINILNKHTRRSKRKRA